MHEHNETETILRSINRVRRSLFLLEAVRTQPTDGVLDEVHRFAHEAERLTERWTAALGGTLRRRPKTADLARGYGLLVDLRVTKHRLALSEAAMVFIVGIQPEHLCEHLAPLLLETRELLEALRDFDGHLGTLADVAYRLEAEMFGLTDFVEAVAPGYARPLNALDLEALEDVAACNVSPSVLETVRDDRRYLTTREVRDACFGLAHPAG